MVESEDREDVVILGGGLAGLTLARQLRLCRPHTRITLLERRKHPVPEAAWKVGESSVELGGFYFAEVLGLADHIKRDHLPKFGLRFFFGASPRKSLDDAFEVGATRYFPTPSYQLDRGRLENYLAETCGAEPGVRFIDEAKVTGLCLGQNGASHVVSYKRDGVSYDLSARWVVDCSGRAAVLKRKLELVEAVPHKINAVWFRLQTQTKIDHWCRRHPGGEGDEARRWLSTNHLMGEGYWVWVIPLASGSTSFGIVADPRVHPLGTFNTFERALHWLQQHEPQCAAEVAGHRDKLQDFLVLKNFSHGAKQVFSADRWALSGEAGVFLDPFYSPGSDFIAVSNTFIADLIERDLRGKSIAALAPIYEQMYQSFFKNTLVVYQDQYPLFGNAHVMSAKITWDYAVYWSLLAFVFIQGRLCDLRTYQRVRDDFQRAGDLNYAVQAFFRAWHAVETAPTPVAFLDHEKVSLMRAMNEGLMEPLDADSFINRFRQNVGMLFQLAEQIGARVGARYPQLNEAHEALRTVLSDQAGLEADPRTLGAGEFLSEAWATLRM